MTGTLNKNVLQTALLTTTATTADQVILSYTVPANQTFYLNAIEANVALTTFAATATDFGSISLRQNGVKVVTFSTVAGTGTLSTPLFLPFPDLPYSAGDVFTIVCTPLAATSFDWEANLIGYLKP
jgi:hypothetical protein